MLYVAEINRRRSRMDEWMNERTNELSMQHRRNDSDGVKRKYSTKTLTQCHIFHHKSHIEEEKVIRYGCVWLSPIWTQAYPSSS